MKQTTQIEKDIAFCIDELDLTDYQIGELLRACEKLGNIAVEYFGLMITMTSNHAHKI